MIFSCVSFTADSIAAVSRPVLVMGPLGAALISAGRWDVLFYILAVVSSIGTVAYAALCGVVETDVV